MVCLGPELCQPESLALGQPHASICMPWDLSLIEGQIRGGLLGSGPPRPLLMAKRTRVKGETEGSYGVSSGLGMIQGGLSYILTSHPSSTFCFISSISLPTCPTSIIPFSQH